MNDTLTTTAILDEISRLIALLPLRMAEAERERCCVVAMELHRASSNAANREIQDMLDRIRERTRKRMPEMPANADRFLDDKAMARIAAAYGIGKMP